jgi:hypothetical protein
MARRGEGQPKLPGEFCTEAAGAQEPDGDLESGSRHGPNPLSWRRWPKKTPEFLQFLWKLLACAIQISTQKPHRRLIGARRAAKAKINPARIQRFQSSKLLGDYQRSMIKKHDSSGPYPDS